MEVLPDNSTLRTVVSCRFFLVTFFCPYWLEVCVPGATMYLGLRSTCEAYVCRHLLEADHLKTVWLLLSAAMATAVFALLSILLMASVHLWEPGLVNMFSAVASYLTAVLGLLAQLLFITGVLFQAIPHFIEVTFSWAFYLGFGAFTLYLLTGTLILVLGPVSLEATSRADLPPKSFIG